MFMYILYIKGKKKKIYGAKICPNVRTTVFFDDNLIHSFYLTENVLSII